MNKTAACHAPPFDLLAWVAREIPIVSLFFSPITTFPVTLSKLRVLLCALSLTFADEETTGLHAISPRLVSSGADFVSDLDILLHSLRCRVEGRVRLGARDVRLG
jgi:hypothetical protein